METNPDLNSRTSSIMCLKFDGTWYASDFLPFSDPHYFAIIMEANLSYMIEILIDRIRHAAPVPSISTMYNPHKRLDQISTVVDIKKTVSFCKARFLMVKKEMAIGG
jgi:hypothetical protein